MNDVRLVYENGVPNIQKKLWYTDDNSEISLANFEAGDRIYSINDNELYQVEYDTSTEQEYSGAIVSFEADEDDRISSLEVEINPVQDLHGYDNPWPAGGGKNKLKALQSGTGSSDGITYTVNSDGSVTLNGTATANFTLYIVGSSSYGDAEIPTGEYKMNGIPTNVDASLYCVEKDGATVSAAGGQDKTVTINSEATYRIFIRVGSGRTVTNATVYPMIRLSSVTDATFAPYSNECPITGFTGVTVVHTGKNLFDVTSYPFTDGRIIRPDTGYYSSSEGFAATQGYIPCAHLQGQQITLNKRPGGNNVGFAFYTSDYADYYISGQKNNNVTAGTPWTVTVPSNANYMRFTVQSGATDIQIELGSTASPYQQYQGETIPVDWQTKAGTVYGCNINLITGMMTVLMAIVDLSTLSWSTTSTNTSGIVRFRAFIDGAKTVPASETANIVCEAYKTVTANNTYGRIQGVCLNNNESRVIIYDDRYNTAEDLTDFVASLSGVHLAYELATPITYQLDPVTVNLLLGQNNIWADTGDTIIIVINNKTLFTLNPHS